MSKYKNIMGGRYLRGLFFETTDSDKSSVVYTLKEFDHLGYPSLYLLYMAEADPTEYRFAHLHLDGWSHWEELSECTWFKPYIDRWRRELEVKIKSEALARIILEAASERPTAFQANKYVLDGPWKPTGKDKAGRPTKVAIEQKARQIASQARREAEDFDRVVGTKQ